jgi:quinohemoprotein ethanol dehydrogenase
MRRLAVALSLWLAACAPAPSGPGAGADKAEHVSGDDWPVTGGDAGKSYHSPLVDIAPANVSTLGLAWSAELGTNRVLEATPVVIGGVMYTSGVAGRAYAFDAATGKQLWRFEPRVDMQVNRTVCCDMANRGVAVARGKVFVSALDGWMYALDARTGEVVWKTDAVVDRQRGYSSTGAPEVTCAAT